jgi:hypothetical protein
MVNRFTWVCPSSPNGELMDLRQAVTAVCASTSPARVTLLVHDTPAMRSEVCLTGHPARAHIIATAKPHTIELQNSSLLLSHIEDQVTNTSPLLLILVENRTAPGLVHLSLTKALAKANLTPTNDPWPWTYTSIPPDAWEGCDPPLLPRNHPLLRPSQSWFRGDLALATSAATQLSPPDPAPEPKPADMVHISLAFLGSTPKGLLQALSQYHEDSHALDPVIPEQISKLIFSTSLALFLKDEVYRKWKRRFR